MPEFIQVITTTEKKDDALRIAELLVERRLAACVQVDGPITSVYRWQGKVETAEEWRCLIKTRRDLYGELEATIRQAHAYDVPEILAVPVTVGSRAYLDWMEAELRPSAG